MLELVSDLNMVEQEEGDEDDDHFHPGGAGYVPKLSGLSPAARPRLTDINLSDMVRFNIHQLKPIKQIGLHRSVYRITDFKTDHLIVKSAVPMW